MPDEDYSFDQIGPKGEVKPDGPLFNQSNAGYPERISVSLIRDYQACPAKAYARLTKQPQTKTFPLVLGIATHEALEHWIKYQADPRKVLKTAFNREAERNELSVKTKAGKDALDTATLCINNALTILTANDFYKTLDPELVESFFEFERNGRLYVGKIDLMVNDSKGFRIVDFKSGRTSPSDIALKTDIQVDMYYLGSTSDAKLKTHGLWADQATILHLRGKKVSDSVKVPRQFAFNTSRKLEDVEKSFDEDIQPKAELMEQGVYYRNRSADCSWCQYFNHNKQDCGVDLPTRTAYHEKLDNAKAKTISN